VNVLDSRLQDFSTEERLLDAVLGLLRMGGRIEALSAVARNDGKVGPDGDLADFLLGVVSATRTLRATLAIAPVATRREGHASAARPLWDVVSLR
jgi:hypothetical protein